MIRKLIFSALALVGFSCPLNAEESAKLPQKQVTEKVEVEKAMILDQILADYHRGEYKRFLNQLHNDYLDAGKKWKHDELLKQRKERSKLSLLVQDYSQQSPDPFHKKIQALRKNQNRELIEASIRYPNLELSRKIKDMIFFTSTPEEQASLDYLAKLDLKFKGEGKNPIENRLIAIDVEFWLKKFMCELSLLNNEINDKTFHQQTLALNLEKLTQMKAVVQEKGVDPQIKAYIETASQIYPKVQSFASTRKHLLALAESKIEPQTDGERQFQRIVKKYTDQEQALVAEYFPTEEKAKVPQKGDPSP